MMLPLLTSLFLTAIPATARGSCDSDRKSLDSAIEASRACERDQECALITFQCPFGCGTPVNARTDVGELLKRIDAYRSSCGSCTDACEPPRGRLRCVAKRCVMAEEHGAGDANEPFEQKMKRFETELEDLIRDARRESSQGAQSARQKIGDALSRAGEALSKLGQKMRSSEPSPTPAPTPK